MSSDIDPIQPASRAAPSASDAPDHNVPLATVESSDVSSHAMAAYYLGLTSPIIATGGPMDIVFAALAFKDLKRNPRLRGGRQAKIGVAFGLFGTAIWLAISASAYSESREALRRSSEVERRNATVIHSSDSDSHSE